MVGVGGSDAMDFHALEAMQCMVERRQGGETGVRSVQLVEGDAVWKAGDAGQWSWKLLESALSRSDSIQGLTVRDGRTQNLVEGGAVKELVRHPAAYFIDYSDGTHATLLDARRGAQRLQLRRPGARHERARCPASSSCRRIPMSPIRPA